MSFNIKIKNSNRKDLKMLNQYPEIITLEELCQILMIGKNAAYRLLAEQKIKAFRIGKVWKIPKMSVEDFILKQSQ